MKNQEFPFEIKPKYKKGKLKIIFIVGSESGCPHCKKDDGNGIRHMVFCEYNKYCILASLYFHNVFKNIGELIAVCPKEYFKE